MKHIVFQVMLIWIALIIMLYLGFDLFGLFEPL